mmetsp:Transcript_42739/g.30841  ORF Transcript_42739/g.30841 Transcript_42739/m.30841 type:complete len:118 (+) Transcript_42739:410-763(+)
MKDTNFLRVHGIMDYSLLLAIENIQPTDSINVGSLYSPSKYVFCSEKGDKKYHISVIDFLQSWDSSKKLERFSKTYFLSKSKDGLSCVPPRQYFFRFNNFMRDTIFSINDKESTVSL